MSDRCSDVEAQIQDLAQIILHKFGPQHQAVILVEEMSELIQVLCKMQRGKFDRAKLNEEFTHVRVSCAVIQLLLQISPSDISQQVKEKLAAYAEDPVR